MSTSNKVPFQATPEQQASMAASGLVGRLFTPEAATGDLGDTGGHGAVPTSVMGNLISNSFAAMQEEDSSELQSLLTALKNDTDSSMDDSMLASILKAVQKDMATVTESIPTRLDKDFEKQIASSMVPLFEEKVDKKVSNPVVEKLRTNRKNLNSKRIDFDVKAKTYFAAQQMMKSAGEKLGEFLEAGASGSASTVREEYKNAEHYTSS